MRPTPCDLRRVGAQVAWHGLFCRTISLNIPKPQQRTLHALAQGATLRPVRDHRGHIIDVDCITGEGWRLTDCDLAVFQALRRRGFIASRNGGPYRITREGLANLRSRQDNRTTSRLW